MKNCHDCGTELIIKNYDPTKATYAPADYCPNCHMFIEYAEDYETVRAWKKVAKYGVFAIITAIVFSFLFNM